MTYNGILGIEEHPPEPPPPDRRIPAEAKQIIAAVLPTDLAHKVRWGCEMQVATLLNQGIEQAEVQAALQDWFQTDDDMYPGNIPYVHAKRLKRRDAAPEPTRKERRILATLAKKDNPGAALPAPTRAKEIPQ